MNPEEIKLQPNEQSKRLDEAEVGHYFQDQGYEVISLGQPWRHLTGHLRAGEHDYFLKMASTPEIGQRTATEPEWQQIRDELGIILPIEIPRIHLTGTYNNVPWFLSDYIPGHMLAEPAHPEKTDELIQAIPPIVQTIQAIGSIKTTKTLPRDRESQLPTAELVMKNIEAWLPDIKEDMTPLLDFIRSRSQFLREGACHGDFVPWHIMVSDRDQKLYLIDNEATSMHRVAFYDLAYMYHRLYTKLQRPDIAEMLVRQYAQSYPLSPGEKEGLLAVLASRVIGGYRDVARDRGQIGGTDATKQVELHQLLLSGQIL